MVDLQVVFGSIVGSGPVGHVCTGPSVLADSGGGGTGSYGHVRGQTPAVAVSDTSCARD
jgi:hypothetical protein